MARIPHRPSMDPAHWARVEMLFEKALDRDPRDWEAWLGEVCGADEALLRDVRSLLEAHARTGGLLDRGMAALASDLVERARPPIPVGPYRILEEVGRGGMSVVYRAERSDGQFRRRVALKVLRGELDAEELHARLSAERQILASLDHPNIARLLDGGLTEDGRPYLVMEYVEGRPLTVHCDERRLALEPRLRLFLEVARAVQHAHSRLVVHRDLKPSNILVTAEGRVRLLDFGIAKVLDLHRVELDRSSAPVTRAGTRLFTPEYASPEQLAGEPASTANDVWALGVILYELLVGARPFGGSDTSLERQIREEEPPRPSWRVRYGESEWAVRRSTARRALARALEGDLDRIVAMALRKEAHHRYLSVEQLAEDVERYLTGLPVRAQPDRAAYRVGKFVRRHRTETAAALVVLVAVLGGAGTALWQAREARVERDRAETAATRSEAVAAYLLDLFRAADPWEVPADRLTARELLARGERRLAVLPGDPLLRARLLLVMGETYQRLGDAAASRPLLEEALAIRRQELGNDHPRTAEALRALADLLRRDGHLVQAEELVLDALQASRVNGRLRGSSGSSDPAAEAAALSLLGFIHTGMGRTGEALLDFEEELALLRRSGLGESQEAGHALVNVAAVHRRLGRFADAERFLREALEHRRRTLGPEHPLTAVAMARLGALLSEHMQRYDEATDLFVEALDIQTRVLGPDHPSRVEALGGLALIREALGDSEGAEVLLRESLRTHVAGLGADHPTAKMAAEGLALLLARMGRLPEADSIYRETVPARRLALGSSHPALAGSLSGWGQVLLELGKVDEAQTAFQEELRIRETVFGGEHALVGLALVDLAQVHGARGERAEQEALLSRALGILEAFHSPGHPEVGRVRELVDHVRSAWTDPPGSPESQGD